MPGGKEVLVAAAQSGSLHGHTWAELTKPLGQWASHDQRAQYYKAT